MSEEKLVGKAGSVSIADAMRQGGVDRLEEEKTTTFEDDGREAHNTHSAVFAKVKVDEEQDVVRVVSAVAAGRILNLKTATSPIIGGGVWGIGMALHEETLIDHHFGCVMNANIAEYHVPVHAATSPARLAHRQPVRTSCSARRRTRKVTSRPAASSRRRNNRRSRRRRRPACASLPHDQAIVSMASAMPWPPPMHIVTMPRLRPRAASNGSGGSSERRSRQSDGRARSRHPRP